MVIILTFKCTFRWCIPLARVQSTNISNCKSGFRFCSALAVAAQKTLPELCTLLEKWKCRENYRNYCGMMRHDARADDATMPSGHNDANDSASSWPSVGSGHQVALALTTEGSKEEEIMTAEHSVHLLLLLDSNTLTATANEPGSGGHGSTSNCSQLHYSRGLQQWLLMVLDRWWLPWHEAALEIVLHKCSKYD